MVSKILFNSSNDDVSESGLFDALKRVGADECDVLYIHSELSFGVPNPELSKSSILNAVLSALRKLDIGSICFPAFTFSFCNGLDFDQVRSKSKMGVLSEFARKQVDSIRSVDPLLSTVLIGKHTELITGIGHESIGGGSTFDLLHKFPGVVKFLFLGVRPSKCFTYMHYVENQLEVPYRYSRKFSGNIITHDGQYMDEYELFVRYSNVFPNPNSNVDKDLRESGALVKEGLGLSSLYVVDEKKAYELIGEKIEQNLEYLIKPLESRDYGDEIFEERNMVAL